jgi:hypothetical protein
MHRTTGTPALRRWLVGGASLVIAATMVGCGSDDDSGNTASGGTSAAAEADPAEFCEAALDFEGVLNEGPPVDFETATPEEIQAGLEEFGTQLQPHLAEVEELAPDEISDDVTTSTGLIREALSTGDDTIFEQPEFLDAETAIDDYRLAECGYEQLETVGVDYEFESIPETIPSGVVAITFSNEGEESHEIGLVRVNDDVTTPIEELIALPEEEAFSMVTYIGRAASEPGESDTVFLRLEEPGRYGAVCFYPQGTTHDVEGTGPPHAALGMVSEFTVE